MIKVIPAFAMDEKKRILETLAHRGSITDSTRRTIQTDPDGEQQRPGDHGTGSYRQG